jgi:hypothetical protein
MSLSGLVTQDPHYSVSCGKNNELTESCAVQNTGARADAEEPGEGEAAKPPARKRRAAGSPRAAAAPRGRGRGRGRRAAPPLFPDEMLCDLSSVKVERGPAPVKAERVGSQDAPAGAVPASGGALPQAAPPAHWWEVKAEQRGAAPAPGAPAAGQGPASAGASQPWWEPSQAGRPAGAPGAPRAAGAAAAPAPASLGGAALSAGAAGSLGLAGAPPAAARSAIPSMLDIALMGEDWRALAAAAPGRPAPWAASTAAASQVHVTASLTACSVELA